MSFYENITQWVLCFLLVLSSLGVITTRNPVHSALFFLFGLILLGALYLQLAAQFIAVMQILVYAGAILVIFMFVIILFQDAYKKIGKNKAQSFLPLLVFAGAALIISVLVLGLKLLNFPEPNQLPQGFGTAEAIGKALYVDFFFPFEAITLLFLVAVVGALYIVKKEIA